MADSRWSFLPKSVSAHLNSRSDIENAQPNIHTPTRSKSISKSPAPRNQIDRRGQVSAIRVSEWRSYSLSLVWFLISGILFLFVGILYQRTALKSRRNEAEEEEGSNQHVKVVVRIRPTKEYCWTVKKLSDDSYSVRDRHFTFDSVLDSLHYQVSILDKSFYK